MHSSPDIHKPGRWTLINNLSSPPPFSFVNFWVVEGEKHAYIDFFVCKNDYSVQRHLNQDMSYILKISGFSDQDMLDYLMKEKKDSFMVPIEDARNIWKFVIECGFRVCAKQLQGEEV